MVKHKDLVYEQILSHIFYPTDSLRSLYFLSNFCKSVLHIYTAIWSIWKESWFKVVWLKHLSFSISDTSKQPSGMCVFEKHPYTHSTRSLKHAIPHIFIDIQMQKWSERIKTESCTSKKHLFPCYAFMKNPSVFL